MTRRRLSKSDIKGLNGRLQGLGLALSKKDDVDIVEEDGERTYLVNGDPWLFELDGELVPHLRMLQERPALLPRVTVDMGAVRFMTNGADVMRPGVVAIDAGVAAGRLVAVVEETHGKPLAVGKALMDAAGIEAACDGKVVATLHWVGDRRW